LWAHLLIESAKQAAFDRPESLFEGANGQHLVSESRLGPRRNVIDANVASRLVAPAAGGGTIYMCAVDKNRMGVSLIQSNAAGFGSHLAVPEVGVFLQNRGIGFSLSEDHPAELAPGRKPPSTLAPALATDSSGRLRTVFGTMGGDGQPQVVLQMAARLLQAKQDPGLNLSAPRFTLTVPNAVGFNTWRHRDRLVVALEDGTDWVEGLQKRGHEVRRDRWGLGLFGHANMIDVADDHLVGCADPRALTGAASGC
jgi:gamma-glutamyltranspeptidase/glutathione hydrolase